MLIGARKPHLFPPCLYLETCQCGGRMRRPLTTELRDDGGERIVIDRCPVSELTVAHREMVQQACIFVETGLPPVTGGQDEQPLWFFETVAAVKSYQHQLQQQAEKSGKQT